MTLPWPPRPQAVPQLPQDFPSAPLSPAPVSSSSSPAHEQTLLPQRAGSPGLLPPL